MLNLSTVPELAASERAPLDAIADQLRAQVTNPIGILMGGGDLANAARVAQRAGAERLLLELFPGGPEHDLMASMAGFTRTRVVLQLRRSLPLGPPWDPYSPIEVRALRPGTSDEKAWLELNARAFAWHPDQGSWTMDDLQARMAEPWFDPDGFLLHERDGQLIAFCWTKIHDEEAPPVGEIFVIGIDPEFQGKGLGQPLTYAGFEWLASRGLTQGMLYVESDNQPALRLYDRLGFRVATTHRWYERALR